MKIAIQMRVEQTDLLQWQANARESGLSMSEWVRRQCNGQRAEIPGTPPVIDIDELPIESQSPAKETPVGCDCIHCVRIREAFSPKKEEKPADKPAKKFSRKKKK